MRPGKNGGWIAGDLSWGRLDALSYAGDHSAQQVRLLRELHALYQASRRQRRILRLPLRRREVDRALRRSGRASSGRCWTRPRAAGLQLVYPGKRGVLDGYQEARFCLDVTRGQAGGLEIVPVIRGDGGEPVVPVAFIGAEGHGAVYIDHAQAAADGDPRSWRFGLARLGRPVPPALQRMALGSERLQVPAGEEPRFREQYYPRLRQAADLISSDGSFTPPAITGPDLVLRAGYGAGHELDVSWEWAYQVGESPQRMPLDAAGSGDGYRDLAAERVLLAGLGLLPLDRYGLTGRAGGPPGGAPPALLPRTRLTGTDTMRFSTELLPLLADQPGLAVEVSGEPADYREAGDTLRITVSTDEVAGDTDWFDLGVTITRGRPPGPVPRRLPRPEPG